MQNWKRPRRYEDEEITEDAFYYIKNHKFKIVIQNFSYEKMQTLKNAIDYAELLDNTALYVQYWNYRNKPFHSCYDDYLYRFNVELWADNTLIEVFSLIHIFIKYFFNDENITEKQTFYLPLIEDIRRIHNIKTKKDIENSLVWKLCKLIFISELPEDTTFSINDASIILDALNYDYLEDPWGYKKRNENWIYQPVQKK